MQRHCMFIWGTTYWEVGVNSKYVTRELLSTDYYRSYERVELNWRLTLLVRYLSIKLYMQCSSYLVFNADLSL
jgi:hypothetical protein